MHEVSVERSVPLAADVAYRLVSDVTTMGRWSPETTSCRWIRGARPATPGARFRGSNRRGWFRWTTTCTVVDSEPGRRFSFDVRYRVLPMARWTYEFEPTGERCMVRETWVEHRPRWLIALDPVIFGIADRAQHNRETMEKTLERLAEAKG
ncbi:MAG TPA: SRPBCC family protein [Acidimicrobiales bacterium]|nr:SRPBCC family protein [Acidimicrobiales bacterium]